MSTGRSLPLHTPPPRLASPPAWFAVTGASVVLWVLLYTQLAPFSEYSMVTSLSPKPNTGSKMTL